ncbi:hypothetical protein SAMN05421770_10554 [Granulicella rosea]|uniref:Uncharacterized protein n=1 Tax=Granulicella rosea TaxID=474952 RepID=A0A239KLR9_9BACT|nr:hypothetical protein [Granulicella rosea]SNT19005.1 hypothetical protein SAMN05421770_10547 [Granulicella rosea]SNT19098.1 hypothetical protein SAMN05421770_10554 [Granulicella rosea]
MTTLLREDYSDSVLGWIQFATDAAKEAEQASTEAGEKPRGSIGRQAFNAATRARAFDEGLYRTLRAIEEQVGPLERAGGKVGPNPAVRDAFIACLPPLTTRQRVKAFIACIVHGQLHGYLEGAEVKSLLYAAQLALSAHHRKEAR